MAESSEKNTHTLNKLADELDSVLDETEASMEQQDELIDDEDAIDRLLMDNAFDRPDEEETDEFAEIDELISESLEESGADSSNEIEDVVDEFADDEDGLVASLDEEELEEATDSETDAVEFADAGLEASMAASGAKEAEDEHAEFDDDFQDADTDSIDEMSEIDDFSEAEVEQSSHNQPDDQDFLMADFDISADQSADESVDEKLEQEVDQINAEIEQVPEVIGSEKPEQGEIQNTVDNEQIEASFTEFNAKIAALQSAQEAMNQQIADIVNKDNITSLTDEIDSVQSEQKKLKRKLNAVDERKTVLINVALGIAILALLIGLGFGLMGFGTDSKVSELLNSIIGFEEELELLAEQNNSHKFKGLSDRLDRIDTEVANFSAQLAIINKSVEAFSMQPDTDDFSKQLSQLGEQSMQIGTVIESLQLQVDALENQKKSAKATTKKPAVIQKKWVVNLVSFKQEWYAKRKAAEFEKKGIPVEVMKVVIKGNTWYRLRVKGFKSKYDAAAYAAKVKKSQNLTSVWVSKD